MPDTSDAVLAQLVHEIDQLRRRRAANDYADHAQVLASSAQQIEEHWTSWLTFELDALSRIASGLAVLGPPAVIAEAKDCLLEVDHMRRDVTTLLVQLGRFARDAEDTDSPHPVALFANYLAVMMSAQQLLQRIGFLRIKLDAFWDAKVLGSAPSGTYPDAKPPSGFLGHAMSAAQAGR